LTSRVSERVTIEFSWGKWLSRV